MEVNVYFMEEANYTTSTSMKASANVHVIQFTSIYSPHGSSHGSSLIQYD